MTPPGIKITMLYTSLRSETGTVSEDRERPVSWQSACDDIA
jgi:hypothetical protein